MSIQEALLTFLSLLAIYCAIDPKQSKRRYAPVFGLLAQPFWFYTTYQAQQWGIFVLSIAYTLLWLKGLYTAWLLPAEEGH